jgi:hypothetical protein
MWLSGVQRWELFTRADALLYRISGGNAIHKFNLSNVFFLFLIEGEKSSGRDIENRNERSCRWRIGHRISSDR